MYCRLALSRNSFSENTTTYTMDLNEPEALVATPNIQQKLPSMVDDPEKHELSLTEDLAKTEEPVIKKLKVEEEATHQEIPKFDQPPVHEMVGGSSVRKYLNEKLTPHLLEGLNIIGKSKPEDPIYELGQFLLQRSADLKKAQNQ